MQAIPSALQTRFEGHLRSKAIPNSGGHHTELFFLFAFGPLFLTYRPAQCVLQTD